MSNKEDRMFVVGGSWTSWGAVNEKIIEKNQEDAFYILDVEDIVEKFKFWRAVFPRIEPFYAVKCNTTTAVLEVLGALGAGFDCASQTEISQVLSLRISPDRIIFGNPVKSISHISHARAMEIRNLVFDNEFELLKIKQYYPTAKLVLRICNDARAAITYLGEKFGCEPNIEGPKLLKQAQALGLDVTGISFHIGTGCQEPEAYARGIAHAAELFSLGLSMGHTMDLLDLGGGFPGDLGPMMEKIVRVVNESLERYFPHGCGVRIIAEPGRYFVSSAFTLACCIFAKRLIYDEHDMVSHAMYFINDGRHGSFGNLNSITAIPLKGFSGPTIPSSIWGPTCDGSDNIFRDIALPDLNIGEWLIFRNAGAYTLPAATTFNGFLVPKVTAYIRKELWTLLKNIAPLNESRFISGSTNLLIGGPSCSKPKRLKYETDENISNQLGSMENIGLPDFPYW